MTKKCVFTHHDLDGAVSLLVLRWFYPEIQFEVNVIRNVFEFRESYLNWCLHHKPTDYDQIFILDLDVSSNEDLIDKSNFFIVDHHETHEKTHYSNAKAFIKKCSSTSKLLYKILKAKFPDTLITNQQKYLISLADDYDSYTLKSPLSRLLNILFWNLTNNFKTFCDQFYHGMKGFSPEQATIIKLYAANFKQYKNNIQEIYIGNIFHNNETFSVCSFFADKYINDLADYFFEKEKVDIIVMVNPNSKKIYMRRRRDASPNIHIGRICEQWGGGGHEGAGGAPLGEGFVQLSKTLKPKNLQR